MHIKHSRPITKYGTGNLGVVFEQDIGKSERTWTRLGRVFFSVLPVDFSIEFIRGDRNVQKYLFELLGV